MRIMQARLNLETICLLSIVILTAGVGVRGEFSVGSISLNLESLLLLGLIAAWLIKILLSDMPMRTSSVMVLLIVSALMLFVLVDFTIRGNSKAVYEINFLVLLSSFPLLQYLHSKSSLSSESPVYIVFLLVSFLIIFFPNQGGNFDEWDLVSREGSGIIGRLGIYGYVSNMLACILLIHIVFCFRDIKNNPILNTGMILLCIYWLSQTFSRTAMIILVLILVWELWAVTKRAWFLRTILVAGLLFIIGRYLDDILLLSNLILGTGRVDIFGNPRIAVWVEILDRVREENIYGYLFGLGFFQMPSDNTYLGIAAGRGIVGVILYGCMLLIGLNSLRKFRLEDRRGAYQIVFVLAASAFTMDFFGQRKIIIIAAIYLASIWKSKNALLHI